MADADTRNYEYVGFWLRFVAFLIDSLVLAFVLIPVLLAIYGGQYFDPERMLSGASAGVWDIVIQIVVFAIGVAFWRYWGATPGKMAIGAKIVDARTGELASTGKLVVRFIAYFVSIFPLGLGFAWIGFDPRKQGFHDKIAGTLVIHDKVNKTS
jgi:uncharacterized RDD family membrane protein YckC